MWRCTSRPVNKGFLFLCPDKRELLFPRSTQNDSWGVWATESDTSLPPFALTPAFSAMPSQSALVLGQQTSSQLSLLPFNYSPFWRLLSPCRPFSRRGRRRNSSKLERVTPEGIIPVLWHVEGTLFASHMVTRRERGVIIVIGHALFRPCGPWSADVLKAWPAASRSWDTHKADCSQKTSNKETSRSCLLTSKINDWLCHSEKSWEGIRL